MGIEIITIKQVFYLIKPFIVEFIVNNLIIM